MQVKKLELKYFRCFESFHITFDKPLILITGENGSGKTSILEALHYACYLRSFRTYVPRDLLSFDQTNFFIKVTVSESNNLIHEVQIGFSGKKKLVKINQQTIDSYKKLIDHWRVITLTEDDLGIVKDGPDARRAFLDQALILYDDTMIDHLRMHRHIVKNRNALLKNRSFDDLVYTIWSEKLWKSSLVLQKKRIQLLKQLEQTVGNLLHQSLGPGVSVLFNYQSKIYLEESYQQFSSINASLKEQERILQRTLFGAHLDDFIIIFKGKQSRSYASRGQQKICVLMLKIALIQEILQLRGPVVFLLDDFINDFDRHTGMKLIELLRSLPIQLIFTSPSSQGYFDHYLIDQGARHLSVST